MLIAVVMNWSHGHTQEFLVGQGGEGMDIAEVKYSGDSQGGAGSGDSCVLLPGCSVSLPGDAEMDGVSWLPAKRWNCKGEPVAVVVVRFAFALCYPEKVFWFLR